MSKFKNMNIILHLCAYIWYGWFIIYQQEQWPWDQWEPFAPSSTQKEDS